MFIKPMRVLLQFILIGIKKDEDPNPHLLFLVVRVIY